MLTQLKERLFRRRAAAEHQPGKPAVRPVNLITAKNIVILFPADEAADRKTIDRWRDGFRSPGTKIKLAGYFSQDVGETNFGFPAISVKHQTWYGAPQGAPVEDYRKLDCDILLRLGPVSHRELDYLAATKSAQIKVGPYLPGKDSPYHLQFDAGSATSVKDQLAAIEQIFTFTNANSTT
ncbi:MAG: hypothetical protein AAF597_07435 [Bacteroidota bacterium]